MKVFKEIKKVSLSKNVKCIENVNNTSQYKKRKDKKLTVTLTVKGMMCPHCEARVKSCLEAANPDSTVTVSHKEGTAVIVGTSLDSAALRSCVENAGYEVTAVN